MLHKEQRFHFELRPTLSVKRAEVLDGTMRDLAVVETEELKMRGK